MPFAKLCMMILCFQTPYANAEQCLQIHFQRKIHKN